MHWVTYSNISLEDCLLIETAEKFNLNIEVLPLKGKWKSHWHKIILLYDYLTALEDKESFVCFIDAFDTIINSQPIDVIESKILDEKTVLFGAETNFALTFDDKRKAVKEQYPIKHSHYNFLNAGTFFGRATDLLLLIEAMCRHFEINLQDPRLLDNTHEDQCYFSMYYVLQEQKSIESDVKIKLDHEQLMFGCTGGRTAALIWPLTSLFVQGIYFRKERGYLRKINQLDQQDQLIDYRFKNDLFVNKITRTTPVILHCPGTGLHFKKIIRKAKKNQRMWEWEKIKKNGKRLAKCRYNSLKLAVRLYFKHRDSPKHLINHYH
jgi:hypothetical protein